jgi:hypothetical protein
MSKARIHSPYRTLNGTKVSVETQYFLIEKFNVWSWGIFSGSNAFEEPNLNAGSGSRFDGCPNRTLPALYESDELGASFKGISELNSTGDKKSGEND